MHRIRQKTLVALCKRVIRETRTSRERLRWHPRKRTEENLAAGSLGDRARNWPAICAKLDRGRFARSTKLDRMCIEARGNNGRTVTGRTHSRLHAREETGKVSLDGSIRIVDFYWSLMVIRLLRLLARESERTANRTIDLRETESAVVARKTSFPVDRQHRRSRCFAIFSTGRKRDSAMFLPWRLVSVKTAENSFSICGQ